MRKALTLAIVWLCGLVVNIYGHNCSQGDIRLRGGTEFAGRVEVCVNETWGTICDRGWDHNDARVICNQLNLNYTDNLKLVGGAACGSACFGEGTGTVFYKDVNCNETTKVFTDCSTDSVGTGKCSSHSNDAGVICALSCGSNTTSDSSTSTTEPCQCEIAISTSSIIMPTATIEDAISTAEPCKITATATRAKSTPIITTPLYTTTTDTNYFLPGTTIAATIASTDIANAIINHECAVAGGALGALSGILAVALGAVVLGWLVSCHRNNQKISKHMSFDVSIKEEAPSTNGTHYLNQAFSNSEDTTEHRSREVVNSLYSTTEREATVVDSPASDSHFYHTVSPRTSAATTSTLIYNPSYAMDKDTSFLATSNKEKARNTEYGSLQHKLSSTTEVVSPSTHVYNTLASSTTPIGEKVDKDTNYNSVQHQQNSMATSGKAGTMHQMKSNEMATMGGAAEYAVLGQNEVGGSSAVGRKAEYAVLEQSKVGGSTAYVGGAEYAVLEQSQVGGTAELGGEDSYAEPGLNGLQEGRAKFPEPEQIKVVIGSSPVGDGAQPSETEQSEVGGSAVNRDGFDDAGYDIVGAKVRPQSSKADEYSQLQWN